MLNIYTVISFLVAVLLFLDTEVPQYQLLFILPLIYGGMFATCSFFRKYKFQYVALGILFATSFVRYVVTPFLMLLGGVSSSAASYPTELFNQSILLLAYEQLMFWLVILFSPPRLYGVNGKKDAGLNIQLRKNGSDIFLVGVIVVSIVIISVFPQLLLRYHFVPTLIGNEESDIQENTLSGGFGLLIGASRYFLILLFLVYFYHRYVSTNRSRYIYLSVCIVGLNSLFVHDFSRFGLIIPSVTFIYLIIQMYPAYKKKICGVAGFIIGSAVAYTSFIKMFSEYRGGNEKEQGYEYWGETLQMYFQGVSDVVIGLSASSKMVLTGVLSFLNDAIANVAILSQMSVEKLNSLYVYNVEYSGGWSFDKILPNVCAGYNYLGFLGAPIIVMAFTYIAMKFDSISRKTTDIHTKFICIYAAITCSMPHMIYYPMIISGLVNTVLVMYILLKINKMLG